MIKLELVLIIEIKKLINHWFPEIYLYLNQWILINLI